MAPLVASTYEIEEHKTHLALEHIELLEERLKIYETIPDWPDKLKRQRSDSE